MLIAIEVPVVFTYALASINAAPRDEDYMGWNKVLAPIIDVGGSLEWTFEGYLIRINGALPSLE